MAQRQRQQITDMLAPGSEQEFAESLPESTNVSFELTPPESVGRKRRSDAGVRRKKSAEPSAGDDPILDRAKRKYSTLGGGTAVKKLFDLMEKPLDIQEKEDVDDYFYLLAKKGNLDPSQSWFVMIVCGLILLATLFGSRTPLGDALKDAFSKPKIVEGETVAHDEKESE